MLFGLRRIFLRWWSFRISFNHEDVGSSRGGQEEIAANYCLGGCGHRHRTQRSNTQSINASFSLFRKRARKKT